MIANDGIGYDLKIVFDQIAPTTELRHQQTEIRPIINFSILMFMCLCYLVLTFKNVGLRIGLMEEKYKSGLILKL